MIKSLLKKVFPTVFLKNAFLYYNSFRIKTIDKILFPEYFIPQERFIINRKSYPFREHIVRKENLTKDVKFYMEKWDNWQEEEYLVKFTVPVLIEPEYGWAIIAPNKLNYFSLGLSRTLHQPKPDIIKLFSKKKVVEFKEAISLRDTGEENYFHFYNDVLTKLFFIKEFSEVNNNIPVIISKKLYDKPFFQYFLNNTNFKNYNWVVQDDEYFSVQTTYFCKPATHTKKYFDEIIKLVPQNLIKKESNNERKVFLVRSPTRLRFIENTEAVKAICSRYGFETIDADDLSLEEQIRLFANTRHLIAIHGAGLTNMIYRNGKQLSILEIFPPATLGYLPFHYILMANMYNYQYNAIIGDLGEQKLNGGFKLDLTLFELKLKQMLADF